MGSLTDFAKAEWRSYINKANVQTEAEIECFIDCSAFDIKKFNLVNVEFDSEFDDAFSVNIVNAKGRITATNERSLLLAVYESLRRLGFVFVNSVKDEECIPKKLKTEDINLSYTHYANYRHRGIDVCAPREINSLKDFIKWLPKVGLNSLFLEGWSGYLLYRSWYLHEENKYLKPEKDFNLNTALAFDKECFDLAKSLGLIIHAMGHGWNVACFSNDKYNDMYPNEDTVVSYDRIAVVDGKRSFPLNILRCANLCLSNSQVCEMLVSLVVNFVKDHPFVNVLHFWLGDSINNVCECENCVKTTISDQYVTLLNRIDKELSNINSTVKIVFLLYNDTMWTPLKSKINGKRFILQFSPITRDYSISFYTACKDLSLIQEYKRNNVKNPVNPNEFLAYLAEWQKKYNGDAFAFDYQNYYATRYDISNELAAELIVKDVCAYKKFGLNGLISCQFYRNAFPHGFSTYAMAMALFNEKFNFDAEKQTYYSCCFGSLKNDVEVFLKKISATIPLSFYQWYGENDEIRNIYKEPRISNDSLVGLLNSTDYFVNRLKRWQAENLLQKSEKKILKIYCFVVKSLIKILLLKNKDALKKQIEKTALKAKEKLYKNEKFLLPYCSVDHVFQTMYWLVSKCQ